MRLQRRFWILLPVLLAALLAFYFANAAATPGLVHARAAWEARNFTRYEMYVGYYNQNATCDQVLEIEGDEVTAVIATNGSCTRFTIPIQGVEYPTMSDILDYLEAQQVRYAGGDICVDGDCACTPPFDMRIDFDGATGYPEFAEIRPNWEMQRFSFWQTANYCSYSYAYDYTSIYVRYLNPLP